MPAVLSVSLCDRVKAHAPTMQREAAVSAVFYAMGLALEEARGMTADDEQEEEATAHVKKKARRDSGSSAGGAAESDRSMSQFAEVMSKFYTPPQAAASSSPPITPAQWLTDCMVSDEQRAKLVQLLPDPSQPFTLLVLSSFDDATLSACDLKPFQLTAWKKLAAKYA